MQADPTSLSQLDGILQSHHKQQTSEQKMSSHNLTLTATKVSLFDSGTKSLIDMDLNNSKSVSKSTTLPTFDVFPNSFKSKVIYNNSTKQKDITKKFDNQIQSYFQPTKTNKGFSTLSQTRAPATPNKYGMNYISFNNQSPQLQTKYPISMNSLTEFPSNMKTQQSYFMNTEQDQSIENQKFYNFGKHLKMSKSQNNFGQQKINQKSNQFLDFDILEQKEKAIHLIDKERKIKQNNASIGKSRQGIKSLNDIEKVKREEKNFFVTVSIMDTKAQKSLKNIQSSFVIKKKLSVKYNQNKVDLLNNSNSSCGNIQTQQVTKIDRTDINQVEQLQINENTQIESADKKINQDTLLSNANQSPLKMPINKPIQEQQFQQISTPSLLQSKNQIIDQIQEQKEEESPLIVNKQNKHEFEKPNHYESLLTPVLETSSLSKISNFKVDASPKHSETTLNIQTNNNQVNKFDEIKGFERKTSIFQTHDKEFMKVTIISPEVENEQIYEINSPVRISKLSNFFSDEDLQRKEQLNFKECDDYNESSQNQLRKISSSQQSQFSQQSSEKLVLFDIGQETENKDKINDISLLSKSGQNKGILKKGPSKLSSYDGTDLSESDFTGSNKQSKISFQNIKKMKTINSRTNISPRQSYFKSFSQAIVNNRSDNESINNSGDESYKNNIKQKLGIPTQESLTIKKTQHNRPSFQQFHSSEYADDEYLDKSDLNESNMSGNTQLVKKQKLIQNKNIQRKSKTNLQIEQTNEQHEPQKHIKNKSSLGKFKSSQMIVEDNNDKVDKINQRKSINNKDKIIIKDLNKYSRKSGSLLKVQNSNSSSDDYGNDEYDGEEMNGETSFSSHFIKSQDGERTTKKRKSRKYSIQVHDLAEYKQMEMDNSLSIGAIAMLYLKLHKAKKKSLFQIKRQPTEPIHLTQYDISSNSDSDISFLQPNQKDESQTNFNDLYDEFENDSQNFNSFIIPSLNLGEIDSFENSVILEGGTTKNIKKKLLFKKLSTRKSFSQQQNSKQSKNILSLKSKVFDKTPSNNFDLRNIRKNEMALLKQRIENMQKQFRIEGLNLDQKKTKIQKLIKEIQKRNVKLQTSNAKQTENLIQAIATDLNYSKPNDETYFEDIMSNAPIINDDLVYFTKLRANKINDPKYLMKFEEQPIMFRGDNFLQELKKENVYIDDEMLYKLHQQKMMNEDVKAILERRRLFEEQTKRLQKIGQYGQVSDDTPYPHTIYQTELEYEVLMEELGLKEKNIIKNNKKATTLSKRLNEDNSPQKTLENKVDKFIELSQKIQSLPIEKLKELKQKLKYVQKISKNEQITDIKIQN